MADLALTNPRRGVPGLVVLPAGGYRRACAEPLLRSGGAAVLVPHAVDGLGTVRSMAAEPFAQRAGAFVALGLLAAELSRRGVVAGLAEVASGCHAGVLRSVRVACAGSAAFARGAEAAARGAGAWLDPEAALIVSDLSRPGLTEPPRQAMQALRLATDAALEAWDGPPPTHVLVAAGLPALAAAASVQMRARLRPPPALVLTAAEDDVAAFTEGRLGPLAWQELERGTAGVLLAGDGAPLDALAAAGPSSRATLGLGAASTILLLDGRPVETG